MTDTSVRPSTKKANGTPKSGPVLVAPVTPADRAAQAGEMLLHRLLTPNPSKAWRAVDEHRLCPGDFLGADLQTIAAKLWSLRDVGDLSEMPERVADVLPGTIQRAKLTHILGDVMLVGTADEHARIVAHRSRVLRLQGEAARVAIEGKGDVDDRWVERSIESIAALGAPLDSLLEWLPATTLNAAPTPPDWVVRDLGLCPGRAGVLVGVGYSGKTLLLQLLGLSVALGRSLFGQFACPPGDVVHLDYEMGNRATVRRYQRLCNGHGFDWVDAQQHLRIACRPRLYLTDLEAEQVLTRSLRGVRLCIIDSLRRALPGVDENDSTITQYLDMLARVSEATGCAILIAHHASAKSTRDTRRAPRDLRAVGRGSSAIFDSAGTYLVMEGSEGAPVSVKHVREPQEGRTFEAFFMAIEDVREQLDPKWGLRLTYLTQEQVEPPTTPKVEMTKLKDRILQVVRAEQLNSKNSVYARVKGNRPQVLAAIQELIDNKVLKAAKGEPYRVL